MEIYINALLAALSPQVAFALLGGLIGVGIKSRIEGYNWIYTIFIGFGSIIAVGAVSEYFYSIRHVDYIFLHMLIGVVIGIIGASILHAVNIFAPGFATVIVDKAGDKLITKIDKFKD